MRLARRVVPAALLIFCTALLPAEELTLEDAITRAREHSFALKRGVLDTEAKREALEQARAARLPEVTLRATSTYLTNPQEGISIQPGEFGYVADPGSTYPTPVPETEVVLVPDPEHTFFRVQAGALWPLVTWGKLETAVRIAELDVEAARVGSDRSAAGLVRDVSLAYFGLTLAGETERLLGEMAAVYREVVTDRERTFEEGAVNLESVLDARAQMQKLETQLTATRQARRTAEASLRFLLGSTESVEPVDTWRDSVPMLDLSELTDRARSWSPELRNLDLQVTQATEFAHIRKQSEILRPDLALSLGLEASGQRIPFSANWREDWDVGMTITLVADTVAWDWGKRAAATREASLGAQAAALGREELALSLEVQVARLIETALAAAAELDSRAAAAALATEREKNARVSFENGLVTRQQYLGARVLRMTAELETVAAGFAVESALLEIEHLTGSGL